MDIKLKSNSRVRSVVFIWLLLTMLAVIMMSLYPVIHARMEKKAREAMQVSEHQMDTFLDMLFDGSIGLYWDYVNSYEDELLTPSQLYLSGPQENETESQISADMEISEDMTEATDLNEEAFSEEAEGTDIDYDRERFDENVNRKYQAFLRDLVPAYELEYKIYSGDRQGPGNSVNDLTLLEQKTEQMLKDKYAFYAVFHYDEAGNISVGCFNGIEERYLNRYISEAQDRNHLLDIMDISANSDLYRQGFSHRGPSDVTIIFASARTTFYMSKDQEESIMYSSEYRFGTAGFKGVLTFVLMLVALIGIALPFMAGENNTPVILTRHRIPMEMVMVGFVFLMAVYMPLASMAYYTVSGSLFATFLGSAPSPMQHFADYLFNYAVWILYFGFALALVLSVHPLFILGVRGYLRDYSYSGRFLLNCSDRVRRFFHQLRDIDLKDTADRQLLGILGINFVVLTILCCAWVAGIMGLFIYTIVLFMLIRRKYERIREDYCDLLAGVQAMADGNLEVRLPDDLGIFNSVREELLYIQTGFKKAVEDEIKSQRMRSELITNVSHDLKTPLTSIITYTNLLKEEGITEEQRKIYIETLDQKSQRLKRLIEDLFVISKASSNNIVLNPVNLDLTALIKQVMFELDDRIRESQIDFRCSFHPDKLLTFLDCDKTYRIFENLVVNILKYGMPHSRAYITAEQIRDEIWITLKNTSEQELTFQSDEITERFVRGDQSRNTEGSGLGLAIAKSFTTLQGGTFDIVLDGDLFKVILKWKANEPVEADISTAPEDRFLKPD